MYLLAVHLCDRVLKQLELFSLSNTPSAAGGVRSSRNTLAEGGADSTNSTSEKVVDDGTDGACEWPVVPTKIILKEQMWAFLQVCVVCPHKQTRIKDAFAMYQLQI